MGNNMSSQIPSFDENRATLIPAIPSGTPSKSTKTPKSDVKKSLQSSLNANAKSVSHPGARKQGTAVATKPSTSLAINSPAQTKVNTAQTALNQRPARPPGHISAKLVRRDIPPLADTMSSTEMNSNSAATAHAALPQIAQPANVTPPKETLPSSPTRGPSGGLGHPVASGSNIQLPIKSPSRHIELPIDMYEQHDYIQDDSWMDVYVENEPHVLQYPTLGLGAEIPAPANHMHLTLAHSTYTDGVQQFLLQAGNAEQFDENESVHKAVEKLGLSDQYQRIPGMTVALMPHQTIGVAWMLEKERGAQQGGCLSDEMGLGKTVQIISLMIANRSRDPLYKTNLVVAPLALLDQWLLEIETKTDCDLKCLIYHGPNKPKKVADLLKYDVVLTTYTTLALEWPDEEEQERKAKRQRKSKGGDGFIVDDLAEDSRPKGKKKRELGPLMQTHWYRVILDEAQNVRNKRTRGSRAVTQLDARFRWCLTGTPIVNSLSDAYGLLRFLRIRPWWDWNEFNARIALIERKSPQLAAERLQAIFQLMLLRRTKNSMLDGKRLIELPDKEVNLVKLQFTLEERDIYKMVEQRSQAIFNRYLRAGTVLKNYHQVLVLLLRLRQVCSHPCLIHENVEAFVEGKLLADKQYDLRYELERARQLVSPEFVENMKAHFKLMMMERVEAEKQSADAVIEDEECPICFDAYTDPVVTPCAHLFCRDCIHNVLNMEHADEGGDGQPKYKADERPCPNCRAVISRNKLFSRRAFEPADEEVADTATTSTTTSTEVEVLDVDAVANFESGNSSDVVESPRFVRGKSLRKRKHRHILDDSDVEFVDDDSMSDFIVESDEDEEEKDARRAHRKRLGKRRAAMVLDSDEEMEYDDDVICGTKPAPIDVPMADIKMMPKFLPSTKMKYMMELLMTWANEHPEEKTLVISQWTQCLQLVSDYLTEHSFLHVKYQGDMNRRKRDQAVRVFMAKDKATIMLMSLKCGGVGLNLTRANRVISLDLGWSEAVESQAFDRVHRLGQTRASHIYRLVISDTVEDRVLALQERKKNLADGSLGEGTGRKMNRRSVRELAYLFGLDHRGHALDNN